MYKSLPKILYFLLCPTVIRIRRIHPRIVSILASVVMLRVQIPIGIIYSKCQTKNRTFLRNSIQNSYVQPKNDPILLHVLIVKKILKFNEKISFFFRF